MKKAIVIAVVLAICASGFAACTCGAGPRPFAMRAPGPEGMPVQIPSLEGITVQTFCLEVNRYPGEYAQLTLETTQRIMTGLGWQVEDRNRRCDAKLDLTLVAETDRLGPNPKGRVNYIQYVEMRVQATFTSQGSTVALPVDKNSSIYTEWALDTSATEMFWDDVLLDSLARLWGSQVLVVAIKDEDERVCDAAAEAFGNMGAEAVPVLVQLLEEDAQDHVYEAIVEALGKIGPQAAEAVPALVRMLDKERAHMYRVTLDALGEIGPGAREAVPALVRIMKEEEESRVRAEAAWALGNIGPGAVEAVPALVQVLEEEKENYVCDAAIMALGKIGPRAMEAVPTLIQILEDGNDGFDRPEITAEALEGITGEDFGPDADRWRQWWDAQ